MGGGYCSGYYNAHVVRHPRQRYTRTIQFERKKGHRRSINDDLMFISSIRVAMVKNHANDESHTTCERQWPNLNPSKSLFWFRFLNNMEWQPQRSHTFDILL
jgi:hypothetical protein